MLWLKEAVKVQGLSVEMLLGIIIANDLFEQFEIDLVLTCVTGGKHAVDNSLHYSGNAIDIRTSNIPGTINILTIIQNLKGNLGKNYDVVNEKDHIHIEYQPRYLL